MLGACGAATLNRGGSTPLIISAAASLQTALQEIALLYESQSNYYSESNYDSQSNTVALTFNFGSSGALQHQIEQGAPVDVFISAAARQMDALEGKNLLSAGTRRTLAHNQVVLVIAHHVNGVTDFADLVSDRVRTLAMGHPESVPAGQYAKEVLLALNLYPQVADKLVFGKDVRQVLSYVETGNVDAGLVYATDARITDRIAVVATADESWHSPIIYPAAVIANSRNPQLARAFVQFLSRDPAQQLFAAYGFRSSQALSSQHPLQPSLGWT